MAVVPDPSRLGFTPPLAQAVIVWDSNSSSQTNYGPSQVWQQRFSVGDPEVPSSFRNFVWTVPTASQLGATIYLGDLFCSGHVWLPNGRLFVAGGNSKYPTQAVGTPGSPGYVPATTNYQGSQFAAIWNPAAVNQANSGWTPLPPMNRKRWYPTVTLTGDGKVMVSGGASDTALAWPADAAVNSYEVYDLQNSRWEAPQSGTNAGVPYLYSGPTVYNPQIPSTFYNTVLGEYPRMHLVSTNEVFLVGFCTGAERVDFLAGHTPGVDRPWETPQSGGIGWPNYSPVWRDYGSSVLLPNVGNTTGGRDLVMILGGGRDVSPPVVWDTAFVADGGGGTGWASFGVMNHRRHCPNSVLIPNGDVLVIGGTSDYYFETINNPNPPRTPVYAAETFDKVNGWLEEAAQISPRGYHSTAGLLPTGRVVSAGGDNRTFDYEVFSPDYLSAGSVRPTFAGSWATSPITVVGFDLEYVLDHTPLPLGISISRVVLMRPCSTTHHSDMDQRYVELEIIVPKPPIYNAANTVMVRMPPAPITTSNARGACQAPRGHYMMFLLSSANVPSQAIWVELR